MYNFSASDISQIKGFLFWLFIAIAANIAGRILISFAVGEDAKILGVKNRTPWMVLCFFIPVCALIYLAVRNNLEKTVMRMCMTCGATMPPNTKICYNCSSPVLADYRLADEQVHKTKRTNYMIIGICIIILASVIAAFASVKLSAYMVRRYGNHNPGSYSDFFNEFPNGGQNGDSSGDNNDDDLFDNFNNFGNND